MFDAIVDTRPLRPHSANEAQPELTVLEPACYLIHIASSRPNKATKPTWNMDPALDNVTWESLPSHLLKVSFSFTISGNENLASIAEEDTDKLNSHSADIRTSRDV